MLLHSNVVTGADFVLSGVVERLARTHRVISFDRPGYGQSDRPRGWPWTPAAQARFIRRALPPNPVVKDRVADQQARIGDLHALATEIYEGWGAGGRLTAADAVARRPLAGRADCHRLVLLLPELVSAGFLEEAPGPRGGAGYRVLDEAPDRVTEAIADRQRQRAAELQRREERAAVVAQVLADGLTYTRSGSITVEINQNSRGLELRFKAIPGWELRDAMKRDGHCRWDTRRRRW